MDRLPAPSLPIRLCKIDGYIRINSSACHVLFARVKDRWLFHDLPAQHSQLVARAYVKRKLFPQLQKAVRELQDEDTAENLQPTGSVVSDQQQREKEQQEQQQQTTCKLTWRSNVRLVPVSQKGPGHRAYGMQGDRPMMVVVPTCDLAEGTLIGLYMVRVNGPTV